MLALSGPWLIALHLNILANNHYTQLTRLAYVRRRIVPVYG
jgi:hypothetical protein